jgi:hypothetical protein
MRIGFGKIRALFGLDVVEIGQMLEIPPKACGAEGLLESLLHGCVFRSSTVDSVEGVAGRPEPSRLVGGAGPGDDVDRLIDAAGIQQPRRHIRRDGAIGQLLRGITRHVGIDIALRVGDVR